MESWSSSTNWTVTGGSLVNSLAFESSLSPIDDDDDPKITCNPTLFRSPLVLRSPSPDSGPCEITIDLMQKHEVRQVYVRSTARVYEMYYHSGLQCGNEYLCTVRCGIAARDEEVLTAEVEEVISPNLDGTNKGLSEADVKSGRNLTGSEDDWVEVRVPDTPVAENKNSSLTSEADSVAGRNKQEFYEATAEITDASPCLSLTLRLLSLQSKDCVYVDEVYVFADPVTSTDSEDQEDRVENPAGSSLMAMLVPTLLQLSKTTKHSTDTMEKQKFADYGSRSTDPTNFASKIKQQEGKSSQTDHQEVKCQEVNGSSAGPAHMLNPPQVPVSENKPNHPSHSHLERAMDQLVSRVGRIEDLCLRFEENMLKPISSIEVRLQRVEQQLEVLMKKSLNSELPSCSRICAPDFSCNESDSNSFYNSGSDYPNCGSFESDKKDFCPDVTPIPPYDACDSMNAAQLLPGLVVTAPEFSNCDDVEENFATDTLKNSLKDRPKQAFSIDDALASALAGFVSSTSISPPTYTQTLAVKAPEFSNEDDESDNKKASPGVQYEIDHPVSSYRTDGTECTKDSTSSNICLEDDGNVIGSPNDDCPEETAGGADKDCWLEGGEGDCQATGFDPIVEHEITRTDSNQISNGSVNLEVGNEEGNTSVPNSENVSDTSQEDDVASSELATTTENTKCGSEFLQKVLDFSCAASVVDFKIPVLDVKFASQENSNTKAPLEALLTDMQESNVEVPCIKDTDEDSPITEQCNLISLEDGELSAPADNSHISVDMNYCDVVDVPLIIEGERLQDHRTFCSHEIFAKSLI
ncbi:hypothetical protein CIPAW_14G000700 [Carya illinoinensis]|uniref:Uncharacterized protein n=2 Tax=Carya illinoinensis TaxID=32201 RepID=A0A8T1NH23_CARIL|nr:hypothetical protein CIPAW_14G000700 [Carya illinoinensis]